MELGEQRVRIIGGIHGGQRIVAPSGRATRPTSDRAREALFSRIEAVTEGVPEAPVLDLFAGSGALGMEALSRGATHATFIERDPMALTALRANVDRLGLTAVSTVVAGDALKRAKRGAVPGGPFALLFLDPPYRIDKSEVRQAIEDLMGADLLLQHAVIAWEHSSDDEVEWPPGLLEDLGSRRYGDTTIALARVKGGDR